MAMRLAERRARRRQRGGHRALEDDPLGGMANLFDLGMVFAVALMLSAVSQYGRTELLEDSAELTVLKNPGQPDMEIITRKGVRVERLRLTEQEIGGEGQRLGTAYRLQSGEVVYVPENPAGVARDR